MVSLMFQPAGQNQNPKMQHTLSPRVVLLTAKGSACSQEMGAPHDAGLIFSGRDSGTATRMKQMSSRAMAVARITTSVSP